VEQEAAQELDRIEGQGLLPATIGVVLDAEGHVAIGDIEQAVVGDGDAVGVAAEVTEDVFGSAERRLGVDDPGRVVEAVLEGAPGVGVSELGGAAGKDELAVLPGAVESVKELAAEELGQDLDGKEEALAPGQPAGAVESKSAAGDDAVEMGMEEQVLAPGVEHRGDADVGAEVLGVPGEGEQGLGGGGEEDLVDDCLVAQGEAESGMVKNDVMK
jgi:hypothetical protein